MLAPHLSVPSPDGLSNNTPAIFVMPGILNASLSEFAQNCGHLAPPDDLHLHSVSCVDDSVVRCSELTSLPLCAIAPLSHGMPLAGGDSNKCLGRGEGALTHPRTSAVPSRETMHVRRD